MAAVWITDAPLIKNCAAFLDYYQRDRVGDTGAHFLFSAYIQLIRLFNPGHSVCALDLILWEFSILAILSLVLLAPRVPIRVTIGGHVCLFLVWLMFFEINYFGHAIESWVVILMAMFLVHVVYWKGRLRDYGVALFFGLVLGYIPLMRQSARFIVVGPCILVVGFVVLMIIANVGSRDRTRRTWNFLHFLVPVLILLGCTMTIRWGVNRLWAVKYGRPFKTHGVGYPLYLSLGFANNPYNIAWDDDCAVAHGLLIDRTPWLDDPHGQRRLQEEWLLRVAEDPALVLKGMVAKGAYLLRTFSCSIDPRKIEADGAPIKPSWSLTLLAVVFIAAFVFCIPIFRRAGENRLLILMAGATGLLISSVSPLLIVVPFYFGSCVTAMLSFVFILAPAVFLVGKSATNVSPSPQADRNTRVLKMFLTLCLTALFIIGIFTWFRREVNRREAYELLNGPPAVKLTELGYRYAHRFNRLPVDKQRVIIDRFLSPEYKGIVFHAGSRQEGKGEIFRPLMALRGDRSLAIIAQMSSEWKMALPSRVQGPRNSVLMVLKNKDVGPGVLPYYAPPNIFLKISDANWDGCFRLFFLPQPADFEVDAKFFNVSAHNFIDGSHNDGLVLSRISSDRLVRITRDNRHPR